MVLEELRYQSYIHSGKRGYNLLKNIQKTIACGGPQGALLFLADVNDLTDVCRVREPYISADHTNFFYSHRSHCQANFYLLQVKQIGSNCIKMSNAVSTISCTRIYGLRCCYRC